MSDPFEAIRGTFFEECAELLEALEAGLLALQDGVQGPDTIDAVFRAVHSIKGGAGAFDLPVLVAYSHEFETALDALRAGRIGPSADVVSIFLTASDRLGDLVSAARTGTPADLPDTADLIRIAGRSQVGSGAGGAGGFTPVMLDFGLDPTPLENHPDTRIPGGDKWRILFEPLPDLLASGNEPLFLFRALEVLGQLTVTALETDLPALADLDVAVARLRWSILLEPSCPDLTETEIEAVFEFAVDLCVLDISQEGSGCGVPDIAEPSLDPMPLAIGPTLDFVAPSPADLVAPTEAEPTRASPTIRVDLARVDRLVNLVGELVISQSMMAQGLQRAGFDRQSDVIATLDDLQQLTRDMQDSVMSIRAQPVKSLFQRMTRIVREAAQATGKDVRLVTDGEGTEIDKTVVERLADPLTHMIRNAIDHGIEMPDVREAAGKPPTGTIRLGARQQSDRVVIEISDDGRGIDRAAVMVRAMSRGLVPEGTVLETADIDRLLFLPGFSTSTSVSALSGRGVGMDVVQRAIRDLNGSISVSSGEGIGCTISISLPLTLAILDGMIVRSNGQRMVIPLSAILETQILIAARIDVIGRGERVVRLKDRYVPLIGLAEGMGFPSAPADPEPDDDAALLFVQPDGADIFALQVDAIEAQRQVVIKGLGDNFGHIPCVSAATILGDGQVALIVDPTGIARMSGHRALARASRPLEISLQ